MRQSQDSYKIHDCWTIQQHIYQSHPADKLLSMQVKTFSLIIPLLILYNAIVHQLARGPHCYCASVSTVIVVSLLLFRNYHTLVVTCYTLQSPMSWVRNPIFSPLLHTLYICLNLSMPLWNVRVEPMTSWSPLDNWATSIWALSLS